MLSESSSTSTSNGTAPTCSMTLTDAANVIVVVATRSPLPMPSVASATCSPAVHELSASAAGAPTDAANSLSKRAVFGPVVIQSDRNVSTISWISSSPRFGGENGTVRTSLRGCSVAVMGVGPARSSMKSPVAGDEVELDVQDLGEQRARPRQRRVIDGDHVAGLDLERRRVDQPVAVDLERRRQHAAGRVLAEHGRVRRIGDQVEAAGDRERLHQVVADLGRIVERARL